MNSFKETKIVTTLHLKTKRNYIGRMMNNKVHCMNISKKYGYDYWDGNRKYGYGGYKYIPNRWKKVAEKLIKKFNLKIPLKYLILVVAKDTSFMK